MQNVRVVTRRNRVDLKFKNSYCVFSESLAQGIQCSLGHDSKSSEAFKYLEQYSHNDKHTIKQSVTVFTHTQLKTDMKLIPKFTQIFLHLVSFP